MAEFRPSFPARAARDPVLQQRPLLLRVLLAICSYADAKSGRCWPSQTTIAKDVGSARQKIPAAIERLEQLGYITKERGGRRCFYTVIFDGQPVTTAETCHPDGPVTTAVTGDVTTAVTQNIPNEQSQENSSPHTPRKPGAKRAWRGVDDIGIESTVWSVQSAAGPRLWIETIYRRDLVDHDPDPRFGAYGLCEDLGHMIAEEWRAFACQRGAIAPVETPLSKDRLRAVIRCLPALGRCDGQLQYWLDVVGRGMLSERHPDSGWIASFDWVFTPKNLRRIMAGEFGTGLSCDEMDAQRQAEAEGDGGFFAVTTRARKSAADQAAENALAGLARFANSSPDHDDTTGQREIGKVIDLPSRRVTPGRRRKRSVHEATLAGLARAASRYED